MQDDAPLTIIGIGSSAGGLEAIRDLVHSLPPDLPVSYVVVQHMAPHHKSLMTELIARQTKMTVTDVVDGIKPEANVMYITPPNSDIEFEDGILCLRPPSMDPGQPKPSINRFLLTLAENHGERSMAIILSGTGSDGAYGVQAIREAGGITIAQEAESAKYDSMPNAAVQTGCVDLTLTPSEIGEKLGKILTSPRDFPSFRADAFQATPHSSLMEILLARTRVDFREYKQTTVSRRIDRRMLALGIPTVDQYTQHCRTHPEAVDALFKDLLISVTRFFRDRDEYDQLAKLIPQMIEDCGDDQLRIWIAGCATGEEAYSVAMVLADALGGPGVDFVSKVQIFATDIDKNALQVARRGIYPVDALKDIPDHLADTYVIRQGEEIRMVDTLRKAILFSDHNVCQEPPFQRIDLICCRNLMIYFGTSLQRKVVSRFHYALKPRGLLFLGTAEALNGVDDMFAVRAKSPHIFRKRMLRSDAPALYAGPDAKSFVRSAPKAEAPALSTDRRLFEALALSLGQNSILVTDDFTIIRVFGNVSNFIEISEVSKLKMHLGLLRSPLREEARSLVTISLKGRKNRSGVRHLLSPTDSEEVRLDVYPIIADDINERAALIVFSPVKIDPVKSKPSGSAATGSDEQSKRIRALEDEVENTREVLQQTIEELETSNEEMQSLNEEMQSTNEELITVNEELQVTTAELSGRTGELTSVLESAPLSIIVLDTALQIIQATETAVSSFRIERPISGQHISQCPLPKGFPKLAPLCSQALHLGEPVVSEFTSGRLQIKLNCSPYFDDGGKVKGVTIVVTEFPDLAREMRMILGEGRIFAMHRDQDGFVLQISEASAEFLGVSRDEAIGSSIFSIMAPTEARKIMLGDQSFLKDVEGAETQLIQLVSPLTKQPHWMQITRHKFMILGEKDPTVYEIAADITDLVDARDSAQDNLARLTRLQAFSGAGYWEVDLEADTLFWSDTVFRIHRTAPHKYTPALESAMSFYHPDDIEDVRRAFEAAVESGGEFRFVKRLVVENDQIVLVEAHGMTFKDVTDKVVKVTGFFREVAMQN